MLTISNLIRQINQHHATSFVLLDRYATGEQGAFALTDATDDRFVLKWTPDPTALTRFQRGQQVTDRLRALGYPAPHYVLVGCTSDAAYAIQHALPGQPMQHLPLALVADFLTLNDCQADQARSEAMTWPAWQTIREHSGAASGAVYLAHLIHRQVDWSIRHHAPATIKRRLTIATAVLADLPAYH